MTEQGAPEKAERRPQLGNTRMANLTVGFLANGGAHGKGGRGLAHRAPLKKQSSTFWPAPNCHPVSFDPWFGVVPVSCAPLCKFSHGGASKLTSKRCSLQLAAASKYFCFQRDTTENKTAEGETRKNWHTITQNLASRMTSFTEVCPQWLVLGGHPARKRRKHELLQRFRQAASARACRTNGTSPGPGS